MERNLIVCCDGTGNEISENISNVLKLYRTLRKNETTSPRQIVFYDAGVGTLSLPDPLIRFKQDFIAVLGLAIGYGLDEHVLSAYRFLIDTYREGDRIFLFGFSRGAHTVRVLAALIHRVGLPRPEQVNMAEASLSAYKQSREQSAPAFDQNDEPTGFGRHDSASQFARIISTRWPTIDFVGVWDTVASVIVPRPDRFYLPSLQTLPHTQHNPSVRVFRQAMAIDERRRMFRLSPWSDPQTYHSNRFNAPDRPQDIRQLWFAGVHADIGGGYPEAESGLSKFPLIWMIREAQKFGLAVNEATVNQLAFGIQREGSPFSYVAPNAAADLHVSLRRGWKLLEYLPKRAAHREWPARRIVMGFYLPLGEPRRIPEGALIHESVFERINAVEAYQPVNIPDSYQRVES